MMAFPAHIANVRKRDYILVTRPTPSGKPVSFMLKVTGVSNDETEVTGNIVKHGHYKLQSMSVNAEEIRANFGKEPPPVTVAGTDLEERFDVFSVDHDQAGTLHFSFKPSEEQQSRILKGYDLALKWYTQNGLSRIVDVPTIHEVTHVPKKYIGCVFASKDLRKQPTRMQFSPAHTECADMKSLLYVVAHEYAHIVDLNILAESPKLRARWLDAYTQTVSPIELDPEANKVLRDKFIAAESPKDFRGSLEEEEKEALKEVLLVLKRSRGLSWFDLCCIHAAESEDSIKRVWPNARNCVAGNLTPSVSEYATKNVRELFAEAFAFRALGRKLPKEIDKLVDASMARAVKALPTLLHGLKYDDTITTDA